MHMILSCDCGIVQCLHERSKVGRYSLGVSFQAGFLFIISLIS